MIHGRDKAQIKRNLNAIIAEAIRKALQHVGDPIDHPVVRGAPDVQLDKVDYRIDPKDGAVTVMVRANHSLSEAFHISTKEVR